MDPQLMRVKEAASLLAKPRSVVYQMVADGELSAVRHGRSIRLDRADVLEWIRKHKSRAIPSFEKGEARAAGRKSGREQRRAGEVAQEP